MSSRGGTVLAVGVGLLAATAQARFEDANTLREGGQGSLTSSTQVVEPDDARPLRIELLLPPEFRSIDGVGNNRDQPAWGSAGAVLRRTAPSAYDDGIGAPAGSDRPSARLVSNLVLAQASPAPSSSRASD